MGKNKSKVNVIIIDAPECSSHSSKHSQTSLKPNQKFIPSRVIIIDEDNDSFSRRRKADESTSGSRNSHFYFVDDSDSDECQSTKESVHDVNQTWVFGEDSACSALTDSDNSGDSDCEIVDDLSSDIRKEWEKAFIMKKKEGERMKSRAREDRFKSHDVDGVSCESSKKNADTSVDAAEEKVKGKASSSAPEEKERFESGSVKIICPCSFSGGKASLESSHEIVIQEKRSDPDKEAEDMSNFQNDTIGGRDKLKTSEEYRLAQEAEWAARREQIKIQQEEAQRLRKRKKAQTLRLLDMEQRQKQRIEEIRESQKRDKETIDLKDNLRAIIRKDLEGLELKHKDFAALLRALGIDVRGGSSPPSCEVNAAFKQALFRFHPDRASKTDIREQVEAEEKFKLISRLRQRLPPVA